MKRRGGSKERLSKVAKVPKLSDERETDTAKVDPEQLDEDDVASCSDPEEDVPSGSGDVPSGRGDVPSGSGDVRSAGGEEKKVKARGLYKPPTHEELQHLKETQNLFTSNLMRLQITELLSEVKPKRKSVTSRQLEELLHSLRDKLLSLTPTEQVDLCSSLPLLLPKKVKYPLSMDPSNTKGKFQFLAPKTVKVVGGYLLGTLAKPNLNVDVVLEIPMECLQAKDHLNYRYFHKRALYLCIVAGQLKKQRQQLGLQSIKFSLANGNPLLPILVLIPEAKGLSKYVIRLHTTLPESYFKLNKLAPDRNNVRRNALNPEPTTSADEDPSPLPPTPHYNKALLLEMGALERHLHELYSATQECPAIVDAVILCKVWAKQRELDKGYGGFGGFHFAMVMVMLLWQKKVNRLMSSYQILRIVLQHLVTSDWTKVGVTMAKPDPLLPPMATFHSSTDVVFLDSSGYLNLCGDMSREKFQQLQHEASLSMGCLDNPTINGFEAVFMKPVPFVEKFDALFHIAPASALESTLADPAVNEAILLDGGAVWPLPFVLRRVLPILHRGLGNRVKLLATSPLTTPEWLISKPPPDPSGGGVTLGLILDMDHAFSILDMGPPADSSEAADFRSFWGEKSELRRFQDGSINEAVVWEGASVGERRGVCFQVIRHLLHRHAGIHPESVSCSIGLLDPLLSNSGEQPVFTGEEATQAVLDVFMELSKELRQLKDLPLAINSLQGTSPVFRHTEVFPPLPWNGKFPTKLQATPTEDCQSDCLYPSHDLPTPPYVPALEVVCQLEASGKWPDELEAISKIKTAFYIHLAKALRHQRRVMASPTPEHLDILKGGFVFRLRIRYHREVTLMEEKVAMATGSAAHDIQQRVVELERKMVTLPLHTSTLHGLQQQYPVFGTGCRLCKRWVSAHLLSNHLSDEAVELMVVYLFISPSPFVLPSSPMCVLLRFLSLITSYDWASEPLIVNLNQELSASDIPEITSKFTANRPHLPPLFIATPHDRSSSHWTTPTPITPVFTRIQSLAKESLTLLSQQLLTSNLPQVDFKQIFRTPLQDYNVLIHLHKRHLPLSQQAVDAMATANKPHPHQGRNYSHMPVVDFNPVQNYLQELEDSFSEFALFFYDRYGGRFIAVVWKPHAFTSQPFKVSQAYSRVPVGGMKSGSKKQKLEVVPDLQAIISDFQLMGEGLVKSVDVQSEPT